MLRFGGKLGGSKIFGARVGVGAGGATTLAGMEGSEESELDPEVVGSSLALSQMLRGGW